jgi:hypothetical protein
VRRGVQIATVTFPRGWWISRIDRTVSTPPKPRRRARPRHILLCVEQLLGNAEARMYTNKARRRGHTESAAHF